jgi:hypothetical protein
LLTDGRADPSSAEPHPTNSPTMANAAHPRACMPHPSQFADHLYAKP